MNGLSDTDIAEIKALHASGLPTMKIVEKTGFSRVTVCKYKDPNYKKPAADKAKPMAITHTVTMPDGATRTVYADSARRAKEVCGWRLSRKPAKKQAAQAANN